MTRSEAYRLNATATLNGSAAAKMCTKCERLKPLDQFNKHRTGRGGRAPDCKECRRKGRRNYYASDAGKEWRRAYDRSDASRERYRRYNLRKHYGLSLEQFDAMLTAQGGRCAICRTDEPGGWRNQWHVDHDHKTGAVRGILCSRCNVGIGKFDDSRELMAKAIRYLSGER